MSPFPSRQPRRPSRATLPLRRTTPRPWISCTPQASSTRFWPASCLLWSEEIEQERTEATEKEQGALRLLLCFLCCLLFKLSSSFVPPRSQPRLGVDGHEFASGVALHAAGGRVGVVVPDDHPVVVGSLAEPEGLGAAGIQRIGFVGRVPMRRRWAVEGQRSPM